jgi:hypothetical protein
LSDGIRLEDLPTLGLVGYELAKQAVVVLDHNKNEITFIRPAGRFPATQGRRIASAQIPWSHPSR